MTLILRGQTFSSGPNPLCHQIVPPPWFELTQEEQSLLSLLHLTGSETVNRASEEFVQLLCFQQMGTLNSRPPGAAPTPSISVLMPGWLCGLGQGPISVSPT